MSVFAEQSLAHLGYSYRVEGERYSGYWASRDGSRAPQRADGQPYTLLAVLP